MVPKVSTTGIVILSFGLVAIIVWLLFRPTTADRSSAPSEIPRLSDHAPASQTVPTQPPDTLPDRPDEPKTEPAHTETQPTHWDILLTGLKEFREAKEILDDADDPSTPSRRKRAKEANRRFESGIEIVAGLPEELRQLYLSRMEATLEARAARIADAESNALSGIASLEKGAESVQHYRRAEAALKRLREGLPGALEKYPCEATEVIEDISRLLRQGDEAY